MVVRYDLRAKQAAEREWVCYLILGLFLELGMYHSKSRG